MGVIYINGGFRKSIHTVKVINGSSTSSGEINEEVLKDYATKAQLEEVKNNIDTHEVTNENLIIQ